MDEQVILRYIAQDPEIRGIFMEFDAPPAAIPTQQPQAVTAGAAVSPVPRKWNRSITPTSDARRLVKRACAQAAQGDGSARDLEQDVWEVIGKKTDMIEAFSAYAYQVARNLHAKRLRKEYTKRKSSPNAAESVKHTVQLDIEIQRRATNAWDFDPNFGMEGTSEELQERMEDHAADAASRVFPAVTTLKESRIQRLSEVQDNGNRQIAEMILIEGLTLEQICARQGIDVESLKRRVRRANGEAKSGIVSKVEACAMVVVIRLTPWQRDLLRAA